MITAVFYTMLLKIPITNKIVLRVKIADIEDNLDITRIAHPKLRDYARIEEYLKYYNELKKLV